MVGVFPELLRRCSQQPFLNCQWRFALSKTGAVAHTENVRVHGDRRLAKRSVQNDIGCFAPNSRELFKRLAGSRYFAVVLVDQDPASVDNVF